MTETVISVAEDWTDGFEEGEHVRPADLPESDMTSNGNLELVGNGKYAALYDEHYVTFEVGFFECVDVTHVDDLGDNDD
jgi:hypothetical protein